MTNKQAIKTLINWKAGDSVNSLELAYKSLFKINLRDRLRSIDNKTANSDSCNWELNFYGFGKPQTLKNLLKK